MRLDGTPDATVTCAELKGRRDAFESGRSLAAYVGFAPLLVLYVLVHTKYLRPYVPESKSAAVFALIVVPSAWFAVLVLVYRWLGPVLHGLRCPRCRHVLREASFDVAVETGRCRSCGSQVVSDPRHTVGV